MRDSLKGYVMWLVLVLVAFGFFLSGELVLIKNGGIGSVGNADKCVVVSLDESGLIGSSSATLQMSSPVFNTSWICTPIPTPMPTVVEEVEEEEDEGPRPGYDYPLEERVYPTSEPDIADTPAEGEAPVVP